MPSVHAFRVEALGGGTIDFGQFAGKKILVVNVASECGYTPQYQQLQDLSVAYNDRLVVVGCPCNQFGGQEPGSADDIRTFCERRFGVTFPLTAKLSVKGPDTHPLYRFLTEQTENGHSNSTVAWNFQKYVLDEQGQLLAMFSPATDPLDEALLAVLDR